MQDRRSDVVELEEAVKAWLPRVREVLERDLAAQLARLGIRDGGKVTPLDEMSLPSEARATRLRMEALLQHDSAAEGNAKYGYDNALRELTYTALNRLVGLKVMEVRKVLYLPPPAGGEPEPTEVVTPIAGQARSRYLRDLRAAGGARYGDGAEEALLRDGLQSAYRHLDDEIRLLFDPDHEYACVWPTHPCLVQVIEMINTGLPEDAYRAADFLGWIYQFFNTQEKQRSRDKSAPRSAYELTAVNQLYTPSWIVKTLVDNTLGRLWLQMHPRSAIHAGEAPPLPGARNGGPPVADYLVPRTGERIPYQRLSDGNQVELFKRARDITLLDPACGTMHFGQYAFGIFVQMYLEEIEHAGQEGWPAEASVEHRHEIPSAILEHNLFGIDIDPRAIQIASLALMITAKETAIRLGVSPRDVHVRRANLIVGNAVDVSKDHLDLLIRRIGSKLGAPELQRRLFAALWENLQHAGALGSLVQVREGLSEVLDDWVEAQVAARGLGKLVEASELAEDEDRAYVQRLALRAQAQSIQRELLEALEEAAGAADDPAQRLFAEDTAHGLRLIQTLSRSFDVVVMNPPHGPFVRSVRDFVNAIYPLTRHDLYAAFIDRATRLVEPEGYVGALVSRSFVTLATARKLREEILLKRNPLLIMLDLGPGILGDVGLDAAAIVLKGSAR